MGRNRITKYNIAFAKMYAECNYGKPKIKDIVKRYELDENQTIQLRKYSRENGKYHKGILDNSLISEENQEKLNLLLEETNLIDEESLKAFMKAHQSPSTILLNQRDKHCKKYFPSELNL